MGKRTVKELKALARVYGVKIRSGANKSEIIYLLGENYGERRRAVYEKKFGLWNSEIRADEETARWDPEIDEEERRRRPSETVRPKLAREAMNGTVQKWFVDGSEYLDPDVFLHDIADEVKRLVDSFNWPKKVHMTLSCTLEKEDPKTGVREEHTFGSRSGTHTVTVQLGDTYDEMKDKMRENLSKFQKNGSGWRLKSIIGLDIGIVKFDPLSGSGYSKLPPKIVKKKAIINMMNKKCKKGERISEETDDETKQCKCEKCKESEMCFKWAVTRALNPISKNQERITDELRKQAEKYNWEGITFPTKLKDISVWEKNNEKIVSVFGYNESSKEVYSIKLCKGHESIVLSDDETQDDKFISLFLHDDNHYCVVKNLSRLVSSQLSNHGHKKHFCLNCMNGFSTNKILKKHQKVCLKHKPQTEIYPKPGEKVRFRNYERIHDVPFSITADFESFVEPIQLAENDPSKSSTTKYQNHVLSGFCYTIKCIDESVYPTKTVRRTANYEGEDMGKLFFEYLTEDLRLIYQILKTPKPLIMTEREEVKHELAKECYACKDIFGRTWYNEKTEKTEEVKKCADHCHITGKYRGAACNKCNLRMKVPKFVPVFFHNLEGYDSHLFIKSLGLTEGDIRCIPKTDEKYISFSKNILMETTRIIDVDGKVKEKKSFMEVKFLDSLKFMNKSLDKLTKTLGKNQFETLTSQMLPRMPKETIDGKKHDRIDSLNLLKQKGIYPYDYMTDFSKLSETSLPPKEAFYSKLNKTGISDKDYAHAKRVWHAFNCETMRDYHDLHLMTDVLLLTDILSNFRRVCKKAYKLDAFHYYTAPGLSWDAMLKYPKVVLDLISDPDMHLMVEKGTRGGISLIVRRYVKANNKYVKGYDKNKEIVYIPYLDANTLYGWAMSQKLPHKNFKWMSEDELKDWRKKACILEVDLEYPEELHDLHNEYPLAPERLRIGEVDKLVPNLNNKNRYVLHHENLKFYLRKGMKLTKIHRGVSFDESKFMKPYIDLNTELRTKGTTEFEKDFYKLMNNAVYGKTMENVRNRVDVKLVNNEKALAKLAKKSNFKCANVFDENLIAIHMEKTVVKLDKPIQVGMAILDLSKILMYRFHYDYVKLKWGDRAALVFTDTDSLCYIILTDDFYEDIKYDISEWFDTSNYEKDHPLFSDDNKKRPGFMKDECGGNQILRFIGLRSKLYAYEVYRLRNDDKEWEYNVQKKKCKGIREYVIKKEITIKDYEECLFSGKPQLRATNIIRSRQHNVGTERVNKTALSAMMTNELFRKTGFTL